MKWIAKFAPWIMVLHVICLSSWAQQPGFDTSLVQTLVNRISQLQVARDEYFHPGMFPSFREYSPKKTRIKKDENIFFTGIIVFTLRSLQPDLDPYSSQLCDSIFSRAAPNYIRYKNTKGRPSFNFWRKDPPEIFPNGGWLNLFNKSKALADDLDDTAITLMAADCSKSDATQVHRLMQAYTNNARKQVKNSLPVYKNIGAYSTWFGEKMPVELDVCVLANALLMVHAYDISYSPADSATLRFICQVVAQRHYITHPTLVSANYNRAPVIMYHISRLMAAEHIPQLEELKPQLIADARQCYARSGNFLDKIMLSTSLLRWGAKPPQDTLQIKQNLWQFTENNRFVFFIANIGGGLPRSINNWLLKTGISKFNYYSPAWNNTLLLENLVWAKKRL